MLNIFYINYSKEIQQIATKLIKLAALAVEIEFHKDKLSSHGKKLYASAEIKDGLEIIIKAINRVDLDT